MSDDMIRRLREQYVSLTAEYRAFLDDADRRGRWAGEEVEKDARYNSDLTALRARVAELEQAREANKRYIGTSILINGRNVGPDPAPGSDDFDTQLRSFFRGELRRLDIDLHTVGRRIDPATGRVEYRDLLAGATPGSYLVPSSFSRQLVEFMTASAGMRQTNVTIVQTAGGDSFTVPRAIAGGTAAIVGEGTALAGTDPSFDSISLGAWKYGQLLQASFEMVNDTGVDLSGFLARDAGRALGAASGAHYVAGTGTTQPIGIVTVAGTGVTGGTGLSGQPTADNLIELFFSVAAQYRGAGYWLTSDANLAVIRKLKDADDRYLLDPGGLAIGAPPQILGRPVVTDPTVPTFAVNAAGILFGDCSGYWIRDAGPVRFERSDSYAFNKDLISWRAVLRSDGALADLNSVRIFKGGTA